MQLVRTTNSYFLFLIRKFRTGSNGPLSCCWDLKHSMQMQIRMQRAQSTSAVPVSRPTSSTSSEHSMQTRKMRRLPIVLLNFSSERGCEESIEALRTDDPARGYPGGGTGGSLRAARVSHMETCYGAAFTQYNLAKSPPLASIGPWPRYISSRVSTLASS